MRRTGGLVAVAVACLVVTTACSAPPPAGRGPVRTGVAQVPPAVATSALLPDAKGPAPEVRGARRGGILTVVHHDAPASLDPGAAHDAQSRAVLGLTSRTLTTFAVREGRSVLVPDLAEDLGKVSEDGLTWTFTLKDDVTYEDGSPVQASDVVFAVKRSFDPALGVGLPAHQREYLEGGADYAGPAGGDEDWNGVEAPDDRTVVLHLDKPSESIPYLAALPIFSPIPEAQDRGLEKRRPDEGRPVRATGPYRVDSYTPGTELKLTRNPHWDPATDPARNDYLDGFHFTWGVEDASTQAAILAGRGAATTSLTWAPLDSDLVALVEGPQRDQFVEGPSSCVSLANIDTQQVPMKVREAIAAAYPFDALREAAGRTTHSSRPATSFSPPQLDGWVDYVAHDLTGTGDGDPEQSRSLLAQAGFGPDRPFELIYYYVKDGSTAERVNEVRKKLFEEAGFAVTDLGVSAADHRRLNSDPTGPANFLQSPTQWCFDWPSGESVFPPMLSSLAASGGSTTLGNLTDPKIDAELLRITSLPAAEQGPAWGRFDRWLAENYLPAIPTEFERANYLFGTKVKNVVGDPARGVPVLTQVWLER
jgi:peptide/nickel transport system substrate-binding protein